MVDIKILVIEDDELMRAAYQTTLSNAGYSVEAANNGMDGLEKAESFNPDIIILDMLMPDISGLDFLRKYDLKNRHPEVKVIVLSNLSSQESVNEAIQLGATDYKFKAFFSPKEMLENIASLKKGLANSEQSEQRE